MAAVSLISSVSFARSDHAPPGKESKTIIEYVNNVNHIDVAETKDFFEHPAYATEMDVSIIDISLVIKRQFINVSQHRSCIPLTYKNMRYIPPLLE